MKPIIEKIKSEVDKCVKSQSNFSLPLFEGFEINTEKLKPDYLYLNRVKYEIKKNVSKVEVIYQSIDKSLSNNINSEFSIIRVKWYEGDVLVQAFNNT